MPIDHSLKSAFVFVSAVVIKDHSRPHGVSRITGQAAKRKAAGISKVDGASNNGEEVGKDMPVREHTARRDTVSSSSSSSRATATAIGTIGTSSITTISIGASNNRVDRPLQLAAKL